MLHSIHELQYQYTNSHHHTANDAQLPRLELAHLLDHSLPGLRRGEQEQAFDDQDQAQRTEKVMHLHHRIGPKPRQ